MCGCKLNFSFNTRECILMRFVFSVKFILEFDKSFVNFVFLRIMTLLFY